MQNSNGLKQVFLKNFLMGLKLGDVAQSINLSDRKEAIKLISDVSLASAREGASWSKAIIYKACKQEKHRNIVNNFLEDDVRKLEKFPYLKSSSFKCIKFKKILRRSNNLHRMRKRSFNRTMARSIAKIMVKKRTQMLKCVVPGSESMDELSLLEETVDYILSLRVQVDVMRRMTTAFEISSKK